MENKRRKVREKAGVNWSGYSGIKPNVCFSQLPLQIRSISGMKEREEGRGRNRTRAICK